jgi:hypothetical protein
VVINISRFILELRAMRWASEHVAVEGSGISPDMLMLIDIWRPDQPCQNSSRRSVRGVGSIVNRNSGTASPDRELSLPYAAAFLRQCGVNACNVIERWPSHTTQEPNCRVLSLSHGQWKAVFVPASGGWSVLIAARFVRICTVRAQHTTRLNILPTYERWQFGALGRLFA